MTQGFGRAVLIGALIALAWPAYSVIAQGDEVMQADLEAVEKIRVRFDADVMAIEGVVSVSTGIGKTGKPCLKIGTSVPPEQVRPKLPKDLFRADVEIEYVGEIRAQ